MEVNTDGQVYEEHIIPDGHHELIFYLNSNLSRSQNEKCEWIDHPTAFIAGQTLKSYQLKMLSGAKLYGIRFYPHSLYPLLNMPVNLLSTSVNPLPDVIQNLNFWNCITDEPELTFTNIERYLLEKFNNEILTSTGYQYVDYSLQRILKSNGNVVINELIHKSGVSPKYYDDLFTKHVGITPKNLCNILKFNYFIKYRINSPNKNLTECAYESGYYDQSHLIKSFHQFAEISPRKYFNSDSYISDLFSAL